MISAPFSNKLSLSKIPTTSNGSPAIWSGSPAFLPRVSARTRPSMTALSSPGLERPAVEDADAPEEQAAGHPAVDQHAHQVLVLEADGVHQRRRHVGHALDLPQAIGQPIVQAAGELVGAPRVDDDQVDPLGVVDRQERPLEVPGDPDQDRPRPRSRSPARGSSSTVRTGRCRTFLAIRVMNRTDQSFASTVHSGCRLSSGASSDEDVADAPPDRARTGIP